MRLLFTMFLMACIQAGVAYAGTLDIRSTKHNLSGNGSTEGKIDERQICVFCHTPSIDVGERKDNAQESTAPTVGWQPSMRDHTFVIYDDIGRRGLGSVSVGSQSIACLSCHDAVQAFSESNSQNDHPFGVPYRGATKNSANLLSARSSQDKEIAPYKESQHLKALDDFRDASYGIIENRSMWWVSSSGMTTRRARSDLPLYSRTDRLTGTTEIPHIECSSCHDPHVATTSLFLRVSNDGSRLCLTCHSK